MVIGVDFDNTICIDEWPEIGALIPGAIETIKEVHAKGHKIVLYTQRNDHYYAYCPELIDYGVKHGKNFKNTVNLLSPVIDFLKERGLEFDAVNENLPEMIELWGGESRKVFADVYIDDKAVNKPKYRVPYKEGE